MSSPTLIGYSFNQHVAKPISQDYYSGTRVYKCNCGKESPFLDGQKELIAFMQDHIKIDAPQAPRGLAHAVPSDEKKYNHLLKLIRREKIIVRKDYENVRCANHYPLGTFEFFNKYGMRIKKGEKSKIKNEIGESLFTSDQIYQPMTHSMAAEINSPHNDWWGDTY